MILNLNFRNYESRLKEVLKTTNSKDNTNLIALNVKSICNEKDYTFKLRDDLVFKEKYAEIVLKKNNRRFIYV